MTIETLKGNSKQKTKKKKHTSLHITAHEV